MKFANFEYKQVTGDCFDLSSIGLVVFLQRLNACVGDFRPDFGWHYSRFHKVFAPFNPLYVTTDAITETPEVFRHSNILHLRPSDSDWNNVQMWEQLGALVEKINARNGQVKVMILDSVPAYKMLGKFAHHVSVMDIVSQNLVQINLAIASKFNARFIVQDSCPAPGSIIDDLDFYYKKQGIEFDVGKKVMHVANPEDIGVYLQNLDCQSVDESVTRL